MPTRPAFRLRSFAAGSLVALLLGACGPSQGSTPGPSATASSSVGVATDAPSPTGDAPSPSQATGGPSSAPPAAPSGAPPDLELTVLVDGLDSPVDVAVRPGEPDALFVVEQTGRIAVVRDGALQAERFLDIAGQVTAGGEQGLLGLAFHPEPSDDRLFVYYTTTEGDQVVSSFRAPDSANAPVDPASEVQILRMDDPYGNHNGGGLAFGPDGYLYISTGDGGGGGDPLGAGRDLGTLLAKILRIDIDAEGPGDRPYGVPSDNPYVDEAGARPETWLSGLRNPWRLRFDRATGDLWIGDVGQGAWEEIDVARAGTGGLDYGWNTMEGRHCYEPRDGCDERGLTLPVTEYGHDLGCSVTGGTVYRGSGSPALAGFYVFADYCSGTFWAIPSTADSVETPAVVLESGRTISAIAEDADGELLATDLRTGELLRISAPGR